MVIIEVLILALFLCIVIGYIKAKEQPMIEDLIEPIEEKELCKEKEEKLVVVEVSEEKKVKEKKPYKKKKHYKKKDN